MLIEEIKKKKIILGSLISGSIMVAILTAFLLPEKFEAKVTIRNATVGQIGQIGQQSTLVEANTQTLSRLSSPRFYNSALLNNCELVGEEAAESLSKSLKATPVKLTIDLTLLSYVGRGQELTKKCLQSVIDQLSHAQDELSKGKKNQIREQLMSQKMTLAEMEKSERDLKIALAKNGMSNRSPAESALMLYGIQAKQNIIQEARRSVIELEAALAPPATQQLTSLEPIYVSVKPVSPNHLLFGIAGLFFGLLLCGAVLWREIWQLIIASNDGD